MRKSPRSIAELDILFLRNGMIEAFIPKTVGNIRIDSPAENTITLGPVRCISNKPLKLFQTPETLKHMKRELKPQEHEEIVSAVAAGDRIKAMNIYLSATEGNLTDAQNYLKTLTAKAEAAQSERFVKSLGKVA